MKGLFAAIAGVAVSVVAQGATVVVPAAYSSTEGGLRNLFPFGHGFPAGLRYQQVYDDFELGALHGQSITGIRLRPDWSRGIAFTPVTVSNVTIVLAITDAEPDALSETFADNVDRDSQIVFSGNLRLSSNHVGTGSGPAAFDIVIDFQMPYTYTGGNLLLDVTNPDSDLLSVFDAVDVMGDSVSRVFGVGHGATVGNTELPSLGLVTQFVSIPEPASIAVVAFAGGLLLARRSDR